MSTLSVITGMPTPLFRSGAFTSESRISRSVNSLTSVDTSTSRLRREKRRGGEPRKTKGRATIGVTATIAGLKRSRRGRSAGWRPEPLGAAIKASASSRDAAMGFFNEHVDARLQAGGSRQRAGVPAWAPRGLRHRCSARKVPAHRRITRVPNSAAISRGPVGVRVENPRQLGAGRKGRRTTHAARGSGRILRLRQLHAEMGFFRSTISFSNPVWMATLNRRYRREGLNGYAGTFGRLESARRGPKKQRAAARRLPAPWHSSAASLRLSLRRLPEHQSACPARGCSLSRLRAFGFPEPRRALDGFVGALPMASTATQAEVRITDRFGRDRAGNLPGHLPSVSDIGSLVRIGGSPGEHTSAGEQRDRETWWNDQARLPSVCEVTLATARSANRYFSSEAKIKASRDANPAGSS